MTDAQVSYLRSLMARREITETERAGLEKLIEDGLTKGQAALWIDLAKKRPEKPATATEAPAQKKETPDVPAGRYGLSGADGQVRFYRVDRPTEGKWKGYTFVKLLIGSPGAWRAEQINRSIRPQILAAIGADAEAALRLFGQKFEQCGACSSPLSDPRSRAAGYGEICAGKRGYWYPTLAEALKILGEEPAGAEQLEMAQ